MNKVRVKLTSMQPKYSVDSSEIAVPSDVRRGGLSKLVNFMLGNVDDDESESDNSDDEGAGSGIRTSVSSMIPFDFLIHGRFLRTTLAGYMRANNVSAEDVVDIHFMPRLTKPEEESSPDEPLPDWVSALASPAADSDVFFSACYDGSVRVHSSATTSLLSNLPCHSSPIHSLASKGSLVASASTDQQLLLHSYDSATSSLTTTTSCMDGHTNTVEAIAFSGDSLMASGDHDGNLSLWDISSQSSYLSNDTSAATAKKRKTSSLTASTIATLSPSSSSKLHTACISFLSFSTQNPSVVFSSSWDYSVKAFDVGRQDPILTLNGARVVTCASKSRESDILATGHPDCHIKLWDVRTTKAAAATVSTSDASLRPSHKSWVSGIRWDPNTSYNLSSCSHDGTVKTWDIRCTLPLHTIKAHPSNDAKALDLLYGADSSLFTGGSDCLVKKFSNAKQ